MQFILGDGSGADLYRAFRPRLLHFLLNEFHFYFIRQETDLLYSSPAGKETVIRTDHIFDDVFKSLKLKHTRLFIPVINEVFGRNYSLTEDIRVLSSEIPGISFDPEGSLKKGVAGTKQSVIYSDCLLGISDTAYMIEEQSGTDGSMSVRMFQYAFGQALGEAEYDAYHVHVRLPFMAVLYIRGGDSVPEYTDIDLDFRDGRIERYQAKNIALNKLTREYIREKLLYVYVPFYIVRYEADIASGRTPAAAVEDLGFFRSAILEDHKKGLLNDYETANLMEYVNRVIQHITDGNEAEKGLVSIMGVDGQVIETEFERLMREKHEQGLEQGIRSLIDNCKHFGLQQDQTASRVMQYFDLSEDSAKEKVARYW